MSMPLKRERNAWRAMIRRCYEATFKSFNRNR